MAGHDTTAGVEVRGVTKRFGDHAAVRGVELTVARGEFFTMLGPSGSGKTTLLRLIAGFEMPDEGTISLGGVDVTRVPPYQRGVNTVFQDYALFPHMSVAQNVGYGLRVRRVAPAERARRVEHALDLVRMSELSSRRPAQLSGGQRQRVALARAIVNEPEVLLLDEPLGALDLKLRQEMQVELKRIQRQIGITFLYVTHDQEEALTMSDRLAVFRDGRIEQVGHPAEVYERPASEFVAGFVGLSNVLETPAGRIVVRPEHVVVGRSGEATRTVAHDGLITDVAYVGVVTRVRVSTEAGPTITVVRQNHSHRADTVAVGERVTVSWDPADQVELPGG